MRQINDSLDLEVEELTGLGFDIRLVYAVDWTVFLLGWKSLGMEGEAGYHAALDLRTADHSLVVVAGGEDVTYCLVNLGLPVKDGQHRVRVQA